MPVEVVKILNFDKQLFRKQRSYTFIGFFVVSLIILSVFIVSIVNQSNLDKIEKAVERIEKKESKKDAPMNILNKKEIAQEKEILTTLFSDNLKGKFESGLYKGSKWIPVVEDYYILKTDSDGLQIELHSLNFVKQRKKSENDLGFIDNWNWLYEANEVFKLNSNKSTIFELNVSVKTTITSPKNASDYSILYTKDSRLASFVFMTQDTKYGTQHDFIVTSDRIYASIWKHPNNIDSKTVFGYRYLIPLRDRKSDDINNLKIIYHTDKLIGKEEHLSVFWQIDGETVFGLREDMIPFTRDYLTLLFAGEKKYEPIKQVKMGFGVASFLQTYPICESFIENHKKIQYGCDEKTFLPLVPLKYKYSYIDVVDGESLSPFLFDETSIPNITTLSSVSFKIKDVKIYQQ